MQSTLSRSACCALLVAAGFVCLLTGMNPGWMEAMGLRGTGADGPAPAREISKVNPAERAIGDEAKALLPCGNPTEVCPQPDKNFPLGSP